MRSIFQAFVQIILPFRCAQCGCVVQERGICGPCWRELHFLGGGVCAACSFPLPFPPLGDAVPLCGTCTANPPPFKRTLSVFLYDAMCRQLIFRLKHGKELSLVPLLGRWLWERGNPLWGETDLILPVPLHWRRLAVRSFNQAALLTRLLSQHTGIPHCPFLLKRIRNTPSQGRLTHRQRARNVQGAFAIAHPFLGGLKGQRITLVDDVYTTGATLEACARTLLKGGAACVSVLTLARVGRSRSHPIVL